MRPAITFFNIQLSSSRDSHVNPTKHQYAKVIEVGATTDIEQPLKAQQMMTDEAAPKYQASEQVLTGSTNLAEAAQSLVEGATDQTASVEEMQATINELTSGIKSTAEELETAYNEASRYAEVAEGSREDMEVLVQAMARINET